MLTFSVWVRSALLIQQFLYKNSNAVLVVGADDQIRCGPHLGDRVAHGHAAAAAFQHIDIRQIIAEGYDLLPGNPCRGAQAVNGGFLGGFLLCQLVPAALGKLNHVSVREALCHPTRLILIKKLQTDLQGWLIPENKVIVSSAAPGGIPG